MNKIFSVCFCLLLSFPLLAEDTVKILNISPANNSPLYSGQKVNVEVEIAYNLESTDQGTITLVIQQAESGSKSLANENDFILKGKGIVKLNKEFTIPETRGLTIYTPLNPEGMSSTSIVDSKMYKVLSN